MMRQSSSRNQRSKGGFKLRHFIQVFLLVAICIWLVYQVKHSRDKKRAFEERKVVEEQPLPLRFSMKDLPVVLESDSSSQTHSSVDEGESEVEDKEEEDQDSKKEEAQDEEGKGGVDDWIDEQDQDRRGEENEQEFTSEEDDETPVVETDSGHRQGHEDSAVGAIKVNHKRENFSMSVAQETHSNAVETGFADERTFDDKNLGIGDADMRGNLSIGAAAVSKFHNFSATGDFNISMINSNISFLGVNTTVPEATNYPLNGIPTEKNGSNLGFIHQNEMQTNSTAALPAAISMTTSSNSSVESYGEIPGNKTSNLIHFQDENPAKFVEPVHKLEDKGKSKAREEESDRHLKTGSFVTNEGDMSHNGATKEERMVRPDLGVAGG
ncbi:hypothetical protein KSP40_PGU004084 [Platanthera guangdongensis]|uniref:Uncharacterized protein n=1 Tax=Platanthera guangdongensis TaxID=2320717 RepID=A0ABR2LWY0_9ASPA